MEISPEFSAVAVVLSVALLAALVADPLLGKRMYARLEQRREHDSRALTRFYRTIIGLEWACAAVVAVIIAVSPGVLASDFGLALPTRWFTVDAQSVTPSAIAGAAVGLALVGIAFLLIYRRLTKAGAAFADSVTALRQAAVTTFKAMLPRTPAERRLAVGVSVTAGICEELIYRGFLIAFGVGVLGLHPYVAGGLAVLLFGAAHLYQGWPGMVRVTCFGILMTGLYLGTGSLVIPIVIHAVGDIASLVVAPGRTDSDHAHRPHVHHAPARTAEVS